MKESHGLAQQWWAPTIPNAEAAKLLKKLKPGLSEFSVSVELVKTLELCRKLHLSRNRFTIQFGVEAQRDARSGWYQTFERNENADPMLLYKIGQVGLDLLTYEARKTYFEALHWEARRMWGDGYRPCQRHLKTRWRFWQRFPRNLYRWM
jgi:hypothetical protein